MSYSPEREYHVLAARLARPRPWWLRAYLIIAAVLL